MTKQQVQQSAADKDREEVKEVDNNITPESILKRFDIYNDAVSKVFKHNEEAGLDKVRNNEFAPSTQLFLEKVYRDFIEKTTNPRTGKWNTLESLSAANIISDLDIENFEGKTFPRIELVRLTRVKGIDGKEWLERFIMIHGLTKEGNIVNKSISDLDNIHLPVVRYEYIPQDPRIEHGKMIHVGYIPNKFNLESNGIKLQLLPYSKENVLKIIEEVPLMGPFTDINHGTGLCLTKIGEGSPETSVKVSKTSCSHSRLSGIEIDLIHHRVN